MTRKEIKSLKSGDRVKTPGRWASMGTVHLLTDSFKITWDDGMQDIRTLPQMAVLEKTD